MAGCSGGFILGAGCEVPPNAKPENVKAMIEAPRKHAAPS
jgi:uroporphyrinogen-III decarboxylase